MLLSCCASSEDPAGEIMEPVAAMGSEYEEVKDGTLVQIVENCYSKEAPLKEATPLWQLEAEEQAKKVVDAQQESEAKKPKGASETKKVAAKHAPVYNDTVHNDFESGIPLGKLFEVIAAGATRDEGWTCVTGTSDDGIHYQLTSCKSCLVRLRFVVATGASPSSLAFPPEVLNESSSLKIFGFLHGKLEKLMRPGDAIVEIDPRAGRDSLRVHSLRSVLEGGHVETRGPKHNTGDDEQQENAGSQSIGDVYRARVVVRRGFPDHTMAAMLLMPVMWGEHMVFQTGPVKAYAMTLQQNGKNPGQIIVSHVMFLPFTKYPSWATPHFRDLAQLEKNNFFEFLQSSEVQELHTLDTNYYTILCMRGCNRGLPLLPLEDSDSKSDEKMDHVTISDESGEPMHWIRWQGSEFNFCLYMRSFIDRFKIDLAVFDELDKKRLVPYQISVCRIQWEKQKDAFLNAFRLQQKAYRRLNGTYPRIGVAAEARFVGEEEPECSELMFRGTSPSLAPPLVPPEGISTVVRNTFFDIDEGGQLDDDDHRSGWVGTKDKVGGQLLRSSSFS